MASRRIQNTLWTLGCVILFALVFVSTPAAAAGPLCVERAKLVKGLSSKYQEQRTNVGITATNTGALEVFASEKGTWTIVVTTTGGKACILASGHSWHSAPQVAQGPGA